MTLLISVVSLIFVFSLLMVLIISTRNNANNKKEIKVLSTANIIGIIHIFFLFLFFLINLVDIFYDVFPFSNHEELFIFVYRTELVSWLFLIPVFFIIVLVNLIISLIHKKKGITIACISLFLNIVTGLFTVGTYATHF